MITLTCTGKNGITESWDYISIREMRQSRQMWDFDRIANKIIMNDELLSQKVDDLYMADWDMAFDEMGLKEFCDYWNMYSEDWTSSAGIIPVFRMSIEGN